MGENLVIVESPAKAKTIEKFLGKGFTVKPSLGHIRDLAKKNLGIDIDNDFKPHYVVPADKKKIVSELKDCSQKADTVWLASDEDREGEAIAWHLKETLKLNDDNTKRIVFHEITKDAILNAIKNPRKIDMDMVMAQQARRILDRLVGFELSPVLWKKVAPKLSAGRVQSVALKLIVEREREIMAFESVPYYKVSGIFHPHGKPRSVSVSATLDKKFTSENTAEEFLKKCRDSDFAIEKVEKKKISRNPAPPFTTSVLQQEASRKLGFSVSLTMSVAQQLYEKGLITYMRTDSTNLASIALNTIKQVITEKYGERYSKVRKYKTSAKGAQEAHEAIRPTYMANTSIEGSNLEKKLYKLIWNRTAASQMASAEIEKTNITIGGNKFEEKFISQGEHVNFDGFLKVYMEGKDDSSDEETQNLPELGTGEIMERIEIDATEKFTQKPPRYSEASLVKKLEELEIGRPSTYAPTISTIMQRGYIEKGDKEGRERDYVRILLKGDSLTTSTQTETAGSEKAKLFPMDIGILVTDFLEKNFEDILDYGFTARIEENFDKIAAGKLSWDKLLTDFYSPFHKEVDKALKNTGYTNAERFLGTDPASGKKISVRLGKYGPFAQKGDSDDKDKQYVSLRKGQLIESITLEDALELFKLPRTLGEYKGKTVTAAIGRFGPYIKHDGKFVSLGKNYDPLEITLEEAGNLIEEHARKEAEKHIMTFEKEGIEVLNGRFGPYIKHDGKNYKIPKGTEAASLDLAKCLEIIKDTKPSGGRSKRK